MFTLFQQNKIAPPDHINPFRWADKIFSVQSKKGTSISSSSAKNIKLKAKSKYFHDSALQKVYCPLLFLINHKKVF
jgi:hypothetical protein